MSDLSTSSRASGYEPGAGTPPSPAAPASVWEDFVDIFYAPSSVFARRAGSGFAIPMLVVTLFVGGLFILNSGVLQPVMDAEFGRAMAAAMRRNPNITADVVEKQRAVGMAISKVVGFVVLPVQMFLVGLALWLVGKLFDAKETLAAALMVACYAFVPRILEGVLAGVQGLLLDPGSLTGRYKISLGMGRFFDPDATSPVLLALVGRIDLFTIWVTVLLAIGLAVTGKIPRGRAAIAAAIVWCLGAIFPVVQAAQQ